MGVLETILASLGAGWRWLLQNIIIFNLFLSILIIFFQRRDPKSVWTWLFALNFIPVFGILFYLLFGQDLKKSKMFRIKEIEDRLRYPIEDQEKIIRSYPVTDEDPVIRDYGNLALYNLETSGAVLTVQNQLEIFTDGKEKFADLRRELRQARQYIHLQYYIIKDDEVFDTIVPILIDRRRAGVEVRVLADGMGGRFMSKRKWRKLQEAGIQVGIFFPPFLGRLNLRVNYRNHRKIVVIDGTVGYLGGFNIGKEYISKDPRFGYWRDTHLKIRGDAAIALQIRFALDWNYATHENLFLSGRYFEGKRQPEETGGAAAAGEPTEGAAAGEPVEGVVAGEPMEGVVAGGAVRGGAVGTEAAGEVLGIQIVSSGPDTRTKNIRDNYLELFHKAKDHIYIQTPYFVPDDAILSALKIAARSGVDVRLMIPCKPDHPFVYWATYSYAGELVDAGARCYVYENGFLHAKGITVDGMVSCYGTANMDIRSFELNFEVNALIYDGRSTEKLERAFLEDLPHCREITREGYADRGLWIRIREQFCRLLSPLL